MLSENEKKAIELLTRKVDDWNCKRPKNPLIFSGIVDEIDKDNNAIRTALNLITKLQKEIKHQKEKRENQKVELTILNDKQKEMNKLKNTVSSYCGMFRKQEREIRKLQKENEEKDKTIEKYIKIYKEYDCYRWVKELKKKDKQIDLMANYISKIDIEEDVCMKNKTNLDWCNEDYTNCKDCIKQYFEKLAKEKGE